MSTQTPQQDADMNSAMTNTPDIDEIQGLDGGTGRKFYQVTDGKFAIKKDKQIVESHEKLLGRFDRIGIEKGTWKSGREYHRLEVDFTGKNGPFSVSVDLIDPDGNFKAPVSAYHIARGFITGHFQVGDIVALQAWLGTPQRSHHHASNCVSVYRVVNNVATRITAPKTSDTWDDLDAAIRELPGFAPRPKREGEAVSGLAKLVAELKSRGWPTPSDNPTGWLKLLRRIGVDESMAPTIDKVADGTWEQVAVDIAENAPPGAPAFPELLAPAAAPKSSLFGGAAPAKSASEEYDPYADQ